MAQLAPPAIIVKHIFKGQGRAEASSPAPASATALEAKHLCREVSGKVLVSDISVEIRRGEILAVLGPSGSGKSAFLRLLNRLDEPTAGTVLLDGRDYRDIPPCELRRRIGMVMQTPYLFPGTVGDNVAFGPHQRGEAFSQEAIDALLERVALAGYRNRDIDRLSSGEAQRVAIARALANQPETLLLDEAISRLDSAAARGIEELVLSIIRDRAMTGVIATGDIRQAARIADRAMVLAAGKLRAIGSVAEVLPAG